MLPIIIRVNNIVKNTFFDPVLRKDTIFGITFAIKNGQSIDFNEFLN